VIGHAVLHSDAATERCDTVDGLVGNRLGVIEEPVQACERYLLVDSLEDVERPAYRLVIGGVKTPGPAFPARMWTTVSRSLSICVGISGRGWRKSSKSAAEKTSISPAPLWRK